MRLIGKIILWGLAVIGSIGVVGFIAAITLLVNFKEEIPEVGDKSVLWLDLNQSISEKQQIGGFFAENAESPRLIDLLEALDEAAVDPRIKGVVAEIGAANMTMAKAQELRAAIHAFRDSGKFTIAYAEDLGSTSGGTVNYYMASAFDEIWLQPSGGVGLTGFAFEQPYLKGALDELSIIPEFEQRHEYKGGTDMFTKQSMPVTVKGNLQQLANGWLGQVVEGIESDMPSLKGMGMNLVNNGPYLGQQALAKGLVDRLAYWDELESELDVRVGEEREDVSALSYLFAVNWNTSDSFDMDESQSGSALALIYGVGAIDPSASGLSDDRQFDPYQVADTLKEAREDEEIQAVIFRVDSPGGAYAQSDMVWREVKLLREAGKPVVVTMGDYAASGGYFVAMAADHVIANPGTITGSIGVYSGKFATKALWEKLGINWDGIKAGKNAGMWGMVNEFSDQELQKFQQSVDFVYDDFTGKVATSRGLNAQRLDAAARGRIWTGTDALEMGLVDQLGGLVEAVDKTRELLELSEDEDSYLVEMPRPLSPFEQFQALLTGEGGFLIKSFVESRIAGYVGLNDMEATTLKPTVGTIQLPAMVIR